MSNKGLREQILTAMSVEIINELLVTGQGYEFASRETRNSWKSAARRQVASLKGERPIKIAPVEVDEEVTKVKKKRGNKKKENAVIA